MTLHHVEIKPLNFLRLQGLGRGQGETLQLLLQKQQIQQQQPSCRLCGMHQLRQLVPKNGNK